MHFAGIYTVGCRDGQQEIAISVPTGAENYPWLSDHLSFYAHPSAVSLLYASFMAVMDCKSTAYLPGLKAGGKRRFSGVIYLWGAAWLGF